MVLDSGNHALVFRDSGAASLYCPHSQVPRCSFPAQSYHNDCRRDGNARRPAIYLAACTYCRTKFKSMPHRAENAEASHGPQALNNRPSAPLPATRRCMGLSHGPTPWSDRQPTILTAPRLRRRGLHLHDVLAAAALIYPPRHS